MNFDSISAKLSDWGHLLAEWALSPAFYAQLAAIIMAVAIASIFAVLLNKRVVFFHEKPRTGVYLPLRKGLYSLKTLLFPLGSVFFLGLAAQLTQVGVDRNGLVIISQSLAVIALLLVAIKQYIQNPWVKTLLRWVAIPVATLHVLGWLSATVGYLDSIAFEAGNIRLSLYTVMRVLVAGSILFWLGRISNSTGQRVIRNQETLNIRTREVFAKLYEIVLYLLIVLLLLQVVGLDLTALAVFGGALGVGLGFGLQQIASNFVSGLIILLDRSIAVGDYVELDDGKAGIVQNLNLRSSTLETFDGKIIVVPNERFITTTFTNWTHQNAKQRYEVLFSVAYNTDLKLLKRLIIDKVSEHPQVLQEPEKPDCEIKAFADSGITMGVEYWMEGIDEGKSRVDSDLLMMIWELFQEHEIEIPFPQREVRIINDSP